MTEFWHSIMVSCLPAAAICGLLASLLSLFGVFIVWVDTEKFSKTFLLIPVVIVILSFCYYIGVERLAFELK